MSRVILRGRADIVGALRGSFPQFLSRPKSDKFPLRLEASQAERLAGDIGGDSGDSSRVNMLQRLLASAGALHITGTGADTADKFQGLLDKLGLPSVEYCGGLGHRVSEAGLAKVYSASDEPAEFTIETHNEKADTPDLPDVISFWCKVPAEVDSGGETILMHSDSLLRNLDPEVLRKLEEKRICYWRRLTHKRDANYLSWQAVFHTDDKALVEGYLRQRRFDFHWSAGDSLTYWNVLDPTKRHPITGRKVWCNSVQSHHSSYYSVHPTFRGAAEPLFTTYYGDQSPIEESVLQHIREASWTASIGFRLGRHEVVIADNHQVQHGRMAFRGPRKLKVAISRPWITG